MKLIFEFVMHLRLAVGSQSRHDWTILSRFSNFLEKDNRRQTPMWPCNRGQTDPNTTVIKLRQFGETVVRHLAAVFNITATPEQTKSDLMRVLQVRRVIDRNVANLLH